MDDGNDSGDETGQVQCVEVLLRAGASPDSRCDGTPALSLAVCHGLHPGKGQAALRMVELLLQHGAQPFDICTAGQAGPEWQVNSTTSLVLWWMSRDDGGRTALHWAAVAQLLPVVQLLLAMGVAAQQRHAAALPCLAEVQ
ncbi:ANK_REP_REGION domain-containing protein, partial [Haematococcus lacustris]